MVSDLSGKNIFSDGPLPEFKALSLLEELSKDYNDKAIQEIREKAKKVAEDEASLYILDRHVTKAKQFYDNSPNKS